MSPITEEEKDMNEIIETSENGRYRVRLEIDQDSADANPRDNDNLTNVITPTQRGYIKIDEEGGPLQYGWDYFSTRPDSEKLFTRWAQMEHGVTIVENRPTNGAWGLWYVMPDKAAESTWPPEQIIAADIAEYEAWANGEVFGYVIEKAVDWKRDDGKDGSMRTWDKVEDCWGFIGWDNAEQEAKEQFKPYAEQEGQA